MTIVITCYMLRGHNMIINQLLTLLMSSSLFCDDSHMMQLPRTLPSHDCLIFNAINVDLHRTAGYSRRLIRQMQIVSRF